MSVMILEKFHLKIYGSNIPRKKTLYGCNSSLKIIFKEFLPLNDFLAIKNNLTSKLTL